MFERRLTGSQMLSTSCKWLKVEPSARFWRDSRKYMYVSTRLYQLLLHSFLLIHVRGISSHVRTFDLPNSLIHWQFTFPTQPICVRNCQSRDRNSYPFFKKGLTSVTIHDTS